MAISNDSIQQLLPLLRPYLRDENERRAYLIRALGMNTPVLNRLVLNIPVDVFITSMVKELVDFGKIAPGQPALCALLEVIREDMGVDNKARIDKLLQKIRNEFKETEITVNSVQTIDALIEQVEQLISDSNYIALEKLVVREARALAEVIQEEHEACPWELYPNNQTQCQQCLDYLEAKSERFVRILATVIYYGQKEEFIELIAKAFRIIVKPPSPPSFNDPGIYIRLYPLALAIYTVFIVGVQKQSQKLLRAVLDIQFKWSVPPDREMVESLVCLFGYADQVLKAALGQNNKISVIVRIKDTLSTWLAGLLEEVDSDFWKGEFVLSLAYIESIESDRRFYWPALYLVEGKANYELKNFLREQPLWLMEVYHNLEDMLQIFDTQAESAARSISLFGGGFRGGAISAFRGEVQY